MSNDHPPQAADTGQRGFLHRVVLMDGIAALFLLTLAALWFAADALLLIFACILFAILLNALARIACRRLHLPSKRLALALVLALLAVLLGVGGWLMAPQLSEQASHLAQVVPTSLDQVRADLARYPRLRALLSELPSNKELTRQMSALVPNAGLFFSGVFGALGNALIIIVVGIYFAMRPQLYVNGIVTLVPPSRRPRARAVLDEIGGTLSKWLVGKACSMVAAGAMTAIGLSLLGVPMALLLLFGGIQLVQGYLLEPLIDQHTVALPPALTIAMQVTFGAVFGMAGVALATPMTAVLMVLVVMLYVQDVLGDDARPPARIKD